MILEIQQPYTDIISKIISFGLADNPDEAVKQSLIAMARQFDFEEQYLVEKAVQSETEMILKNNEKLTSANDVFTLAGL